MKTSVFKNGILPEFRHVKTYGDYINKYKQLIAIYIGSYMIAGISTAELINLMISNSKGYDNGNKTFVALLVTLATYLFVGYEQINLIVIKETKKEIERNKVLNKVFDYKNPFKNKR
jgi:hypothetical protein